MAGMASRMGRSTAGVFVVIVVGAAAIVSGCAKPLPPIASSVTTLGALGYSGMAIDDTNGHLFVSSQLSGVVTVLDLGGTVISTLPMPGAGRMVVSGGSLFVGTVDGSIGRVDLASLTVEAPLATGLGGHVDDLVSAAGQIWAEVGQCNTGGLVLDAVDPASGAVRTHTHRSIGLFDVCYALAASPNAPLIFGAEKDDGPSALARIDVSAASPTVSYQDTSNSNTPMLSGFGDLTVSSDGTFLYVSGVWSQNHTFYVVHRFHTSDLTLDVATYAPTIYPNGVAVTTANGGRVAVTAAVGSFQIYATDNPSTPLFEQAFTSPSDGLLARGVLFSVFGTRVFVVSGETDTTRPVTNPQYVRVHIFTVS